MSPGGGLISAWGTNAIRNAFEEGSLSETFNVPGSGTNMSGGCSSPLAFIEQASIISFLTSSLRSEIPCFYVPGVAKCFWQ